MSETRVARPEPTRPRRLLTTGVLIGTALTGITAAWAISFPYGSLVWGLVTFAAGVVVGLGFVALLVVCVLARRFSVGLLVPVLVLGLLLAATTQDWAVGARFALSRPAFEDLVAARGEVGPDAPCPGRVGSYRVSRCMTDESDTYFYNPDGGFLGGVGFAYLPEGEPAPDPNRSWRSFRQLSGPWYAFQEDF